jgi:hypothetical protein
MPKTKTANRSELSARRREDNKDYHSNPNEQNHQERFHPDRVRKNENPLQRHIEARTFTNPNTKTREPRFFTSVAATRSIEARNSIAKAQKERSQVPESTLRSQVELRAVKFRERVTAHSNNLRAEKIKKELAAIEARKNQPTTSSKAENPVQKLKGLANGVERKTQEQNRMTGKEGGSAFMQLMRYRLAKVEQMKKNVKNNDEQQKKGEQKTVTATKNHTLQKTELPVLPEEFLLPQDEQQLQKLALDWTEKYGTTTAQRMLDVRNVTGKKVSLLELLTTKIQTTTTTETTVTTATATTVAMKTEVQQEAVQGVQSITEKQMQTSLFSKMKEGVKKRAILVKNVLKKKEEKEKKSSFIVDQKAARVREGQGLIASLQAFAVKPYGEEVTGEELQTRIDKTAPNQAVSKFAKEIGKHVDGSYVEWWEAVKNIKPVKNALEAVTSIRALIKEKPPVERVRYLAHNVVSWIDILRVLFGERNEQTEAA